MIKSINGAQPTVALNILDTTMCCSSIMLWWTVVVMVALCPREIASFATTPIPPTLESKRQFHSSRSSSTALSFLDVPTTSDRATKDGLEDLGIPMPLGLRNLLSTTPTSPRCTPSPSICRRIWIVDNSGSMAMHDGHSLLVTIDKSAECSRWAEVQETVQCHAELASRLQAPTEFRLLNPLSSTQGIESNHVWVRKNTDRLHVGSSHSRRNQQKDAKRVQKVLSQHNPKGCTPLPHAIDDVRHTILQMLPELEATNSRVALIIATDGSNYNKDTIGNDMDEHDRQEQVRAALTSLQGLPVHVVIRLCTDYEPLVDFYNDLDVSLENLSLDVIDDYANEADQVYHHNPWLNYALPLHRVREMGQVSYLWDRLDERPLSQREIQDFCTLLFGVDLVPSTEGNSCWETFCDVVESWQADEDLQFNPYHKTMKSWIDTSLLKKIFLSENHRSL